MITTIWGVLTGTIFALTGTRSWHDLLFSALTVALGLWAQDRKRRAAAPENSAVTAVDTTDGARNRDAT